MTGAVLPEQGTDRATLLAELEDMREGEGPWTSFHDRWLNDRDLLIDDGLLEIARQAHALFFTKGNGAPAVMAMQDDLVAMALALLDGRPGTACGEITSGGTESLFIAARTALDHARRRGIAAAMPELVMAQTGYPAFEKFAPLLGYRVVRVPVDADFRADVAAMEAALTDRTFMILASVPPWTHGVCDPVADLARLARERGLWLHVDACVGGLLAPFVRRLGRPVPRFGFDVPGVASISADFHKYGYAPKGVSSIFWATPELRGEQHFSFDGWSAGLYRSGVLTGTRSGGAIAGAWAVMRHLGAEGYLRRTRAVLDAKDRLVGAIAANPHLVLYGEPELATLTFGSPDLDIFAVQEVMAERGWPLSRCTRPDGIQIVVAPYRDSVVDALVADLERAVAVVHQGGLQRRSDAVVYFDEIRA